MTAAKEVPLNVALGSPRGVEGWLALLTFALGVGAPARRLFGVWEEIVTSESKNAALGSSPLWHSITTTYWTAAILAAAVSMFGAWFLLKTIDKTTPIKVIACMWVSGPIATLLIWASVAKVSNVPFSPVEPALLRR